MVIKIRHIFDVFKFFLAKSLSIFIKSKKEIWLIGERKGEAKDNGYHLFKYIRENKSENRVFYVIDRKSKDFSKVKKYENVLEYGSFKHYVYICLANKFICAHLGSCLIDTPIIWKALSLKLIQGKRIFIQHGITISSHEALKYKNSKMDYFICGGKPEYKYVKENFGYPAGCVKYLGFCRFDNLYNNELSNQILVMPTWRAWLGGETWGGNDYNEFLKSEYYLNYKSLINNTDLIDYLEKNNLSLIFYPHYEMQKYIEAFKSTSDRVVIADKENYDVQKLLKESRMLITDYSSVAFDFAYMKKPIYYYQFDSKEYYSKHYNKGYFDYEKDGFGKVCVCEQELVDCISKDINGHRYDEFYRKRTENFFELYDNKNCKRNYDLLKSI